MSTEGFLSSSTVFAARLYSPDRNGLGEKILCRVNFVLAYLGFKA